MQYGYQPKDPGQKYRGILIVVALHVLLAWAIVSGTAKKGLDIIKKPLEAVVIQEVIIPPPPPPPPPPPIKEIKPPEVKAPKVVAPAPPPFVPPPEVAPQQTAAPAIASVATPSPVPAVIAPPPQVEAPAAAKPARSEIGVACPTQVAPEMPKRAIQDGIFGVVRAQALIREGAVREVTILSGPRIFHAAVKAAMMQYKCTNDSGDITATQEFNFKIE